MSYGRTCSPFTLGLYHEFVDLVDRYDMSVSQQTSRGFIVLDLNLTLYEHINVYASDE